MSTKNNARACRRRGCGGGRGRGRGGDREGCSATKKNLKIHISILCFVVFRSRLRGRVSPRGVRGSSLGDLERRETKPIRLQAAEVAFGVPRGGNASREDAPRSDPGTDAWPTPVLNVHFP